MGQPRGSRRKVVTISSDTEEETALESLPAALSEDDERLPVKPAKRESGRPRPVNRAKRTQQPTPVTSTQEASSQKSPAKPKASRLKGAAKEAPKEIGRPIYSFFNASTQRQRLSQPSASPEKPALQDDLEAIHDGSEDDGSSLRVSKGSSTALAVRKRKIQHENINDEATSLAPPATQKFRKTSDGGRTPSFSVINEDKRPWTEQFAPSDLSELAVHKRKVADVRQWLEGTMSGKRQKVLVLKGAAGTGKTATIRLLAREMRAVVAEWQNPASVDQSAEGAVSAATHFQDFVGRAGKSAGLALFTGDLSKPGLAPAEEGRQDDRRQVLLIEEFPNTFSRTSSTLQAFRSTLLQYVSGSPVQHGSPTPVILIISETLLSTNTAAADSFTAHRLLGPELINHPYINTIEFNPVAPTILVKALETIVIREARKSGRRKTPGPQVLKRLAETGDIRSAVSSLEFLCLRGDENDIWSSKVQFTKPKKKSEPAMTKAEEEALKLISNRESSLGIFHSVGRVVYNNRIDPPAGQPLAQPPPWLPQHRRTKIPERDIDSLIDELGTETSTFIAALHENYALSCSTTSVEETLDSLSGCADNISDADLLSIDRFSVGTRAFSGSAMDGLRQDEMAFQVSVRGMLFCLPSPVHRSAAAGKSKADAHRMFYPTSLKLWKAKEEIEGLIDLLTARAQRGELSGSHLHHAPHKAATHGDGVESWKRNKSLESEPRKDSDIADEQHVALSSLTQVEMLMERLPYMAQILFARQRTSEPSPLVQQITSVSRMSERGVPAQDDEEPEQDEAQAEGAVEAWTTDRPDVEMLPSEPRPNTRGKGRSKQETEGGGLAIPVERAVEKLVLEDDDIVDD